MDSFKPAYKKIKEFLSSSFSRFFDICRQMLPKRRSKLNIGQRQIELDKKLVFSLSKSRIPSFKQLKYIKKFLTPKEIWSLRICYIIIALNLFFLGINFYLSHLQVVSIAGGQYIEGLIGSPKYINPLYASISDVDNDISQLIFSSLFIRDKDGGLKKDLAENYEISADNKTYTFNIKQNVKWHDGKPLTIDDIIFTFYAIKEKKYKSPLRTGFTGVEIEKIDERALKFTLANPYAAFLELLTFGIMPADLWSQISPESANLSEYIIKPIGSGPYKFSQLAKDKAGNIKEYDLVINEDYYNQPPLVNINFKFFSSFDEAVLALNNNIIDGISYLPNELDGAIITPNAYNFYKLSLPQLNALFFNKDSNASLGDKAVRQALAYAINKNEIISQVLNNSAYNADGPILPNSFAYNKDIKKYDFNQTEANRLLAEAKWQLAEITAEEIKKSEQEKDAADVKLKEQALKILQMGQGKWRKKDNNYLLIKLVTIDRAENQKVAEAIKKYWEAIGVKTELEIIPASRIQSDIIKTRKFDVLFYGQVVGADPDPYAFWHSSQAGENGLNIANFSDKEADKLLEDARLISDAPARREKYIKFQNIIADYVPAIFLYSPVYTYIQGKDVKGFNVKNILVPADRFVNVNEWYIKTGKKLIW